MPTPPARDYEWIVGTHDPDRLDRFLVRQLAGCSRRQVRAAVDAGAVLVNGRAGRKGQTLRVGDAIRVDDAALSREPAPQPDLALTILHLDDEVIAVDKPPGMPSVALRGSDRGTVANYLLGRHPELRGVGRSAWEAGLVHRLDTATSGVLIAARTNAAWQSLRAQFRARQVVKVYLAIVAGETPHRGTIDVPIAHHPRRARKMCVCVQPERARALRARPARTRYRRLRRLETASLVAVQIPTGVRHQIRVHLASVGHPVLGDTRYGGPAATRAARLLLHAVRVRAAHPTSGQALVVTSQMPDEFRTVVRGLARTGPTGGR